MLFTSSVFLIFLAIVIIACVVTPGKHRWKLLLVASLVFYGVSGPWYLAYIAATILSTYVCGLRIGKLHRDQEGYLKANKDGLSKEDKKRYKASNKSARAKWAAACLLLNFIILAVVKYLDFVILNINALFRLTGTGGEIAFFRFALPLGISFYTFQTMGYIIDVYRGKQPAVRNPAKLALFTSFFPQVIQGPISRFGDLSATLFSTDRITSADISLGLQRVLLGFFKKLIVADRLIIAVKAIVSEQGGDRGVYFLVVALLYAVTLYADFTGGIDITIGVAQALGVKVKENFDRPFYAVSTADYWRRWHITMGTWFRDYLFYPISVSKPMLKLTRFTRAKLGDGFGKRAPVYISTIVVWFMTGVWHGASWNFVIWGLLNGAILIISEECTPLYRKFHERTKAGQLAVYRGFQIARTFCLMSLIRALDIYPNPGNYFKSIGSVFTGFGARRLFDGSLLHFGLSAADYIIAIAGTTLLVVMGRVGRNEDVRAVLSRRPAAVRYAVYIAMVLIIVVFGAYGNGYDASQFIYNQF